MQPKGPKCGRMKAHRMRVRMKKKLEQQPLIDVLYIRCSADILEVHNFVFLCVCVRVSHSHMCKRHSPSLNER